TSMAMILRAGHIPTRYVNGFLVAERSRFGNYWVTRDRDAHAWVEAYLPGHGWVTADPTPPSALASPPVPVWRETVEWLMAGGKQLLNRLRQNPSALLKSWPVALLLFYLLYRFGRRLRLRLPSRSTRPVAPELSRLQALLARCEKAQAAEGRERDPSLTVLEWADSLPDDRVRQFLAGYSVLRYAQAVPNAGEVDDLEKLLP
ncbi:MAG: transglutaminase family protein, partial [Candidatus Eremiobacteraeota bacterium]|nr:transglutaminase family protein [Candidatus Eremiobacteraeota bacterium]